VGERREKMEEKRKGEKTLLPSSSLAHPFFLLLFFLFETKNPKQ
jgi:hypothetical protein